jgi:hypothetical protein
MATEDSNETVKRLKDMAEMHRVCYEVWPELLIVKGQQVKVDFDLELVGTHEHGTSTLSPVLSMKILHRHGFDQPVDECEERCLKEMRSKLAELGVRAGEWRPIKSQAQRSA